MTICSNRQKPKYLRLQWTMQDLMCSGNPLALLLKIDGIREMGVCCNVMCVLYRLHAKTNRSNRLALPMHLYSVGTQKSHCHSSLSHLAKDGTAAINVCGTLDGPTPEKITHYNNGSARAR